MDLRQVPPGEQRAGVLLAGRRDVGMADHIAGGDGMAGDDAGGQRDQRLDLGGGKGAIAEFIAGIDQFDPDGARIDVGFTTPRRHSRMPGPHRLRHQGEYPAVLLDQVMGADLGRGIAEPRQGRRPIRHAGVVHHQHVDDRAPARLEIGRGMGDH